MTRPLRGVVPHEPVGTPADRRRPRRRRRDAPGTRRLRRGARDHQPEPARRRGGARRRRRRGRRRCHGPARWPARRGHRAAGGRGRAPAAARRWSPSSPARTTAAPRRAPRRWRAAGVATVVFAVRDPHPTAGGGAAVLRAAGVAVREGALAEEVRARPAAGLAARRADRPARTSPGSSRPPWTGAAPQRTAPAAGSPARPPGPRCTRLRAAVDAIVVGTGTVLADDPALTARRTDGSLRERSPLRVVVGHRDVPHGFALDAPDVLHLRTHDPDAVLAALHARGVVDVLLEGGPRLAGAFVAAASGGPGARVPRPGAAGRRPRGARRRRRGNDRRHRAVAGGRGAPGRCRRRRRRATRRRRRRGGTGPGLRSPARSADGQTLREGAV